MGDGNSDLVGADLRAGDGVVVGPRDRERAGGKGDRSHGGRRAVGGHFDPEVVDVFLGIPEETWPAIANNQQQILELSSESDKTSFMHRLGLGAVLNRER